MKNVLEKRIGIIGGGQLGKMMILEAKRLGVYVVTLDPSMHCPSHSISDEHIVADFHDEKAIRELADKVDIITYEFEHISAEVLARLGADGHVIYPAVSSLMSIQDKFIQKTKLRENGIKVPNFELITDFNRLCEYADRGGYPFILKSCKNGYDGKGNFLVRDENGLQIGFDALGGSFQGLMAEEFIDFDMEVSIIATRGIDGQKAVYPAAENVHVDNILDITTVPAVITAGLQANVCDIAEKVIDIFEGVGTFCVEMFVKKPPKNSSFIVTKSFSFRRFLDENNVIYVNEVAPRPHNSGHYTIEGCRVNQFENHIRAILGLPLGDTSLLHNAVIMRNLLGQSDGEARAEGLERAYEVPGVNVHVYGKRQCKTQRKMGHYTITGGTLEDVRCKDEKIKGIIKITGSVTHPI